MTGALTGLTNAVTLYKYGFGLSRDGDLTEIWKIVSKWRCAKPDAWPHSSCKIPSMAAARHWGRPWMQHKDGDEGGGQIITSL